MKSFNIKKYSLLLCVFTLFVLLTKSPLPLCKQRVDSIKVTIFIESTLCCWNSMFLKIQILRQMIYQCANMPPFALKLSKDQN